jgi:mannose-6-phosphate isomerase-like protein (cupin superfamily)
MSDASMRTRKRTKNMKKQGKNFTASSIGDIRKLGRVTLHEELALTGCEISINELPAGVGVPFVHAHKRNEEVYVILAGKGRFHIDGEEFDVEEGSVVRIDPEGARCITADARDPIRFICIQTDAKSLVQFTEGDGVPVDAKTTWMK